MAVSPFLQLFAPLKSCVHIPCVRLRHVPLRGHPALACRPAGSLGQIATRIGEFGGDLLGVDILERDGARAVDELTVEIPDGHEPEDLAKALSQLPGVEVEDLRHRVSQAPFAGRDPLDTAVLLAESVGAIELSSVLAEGVCTAFACDWCAVLDMSGGEVTALAKVGNPPSAQWLGAFVAGARAGLSLALGEGEGLVGPRDVACAPLTVSGLVVVAGRGSTVSKPGTPSASAALPCRGCQVERVQPFAHPVVPPVGLRRVSQLAVRHLLTTGAQYSSSTRGANVRFMGVIPGAEAARDST